MSDAQLSQVARHTTLFAKLRFSYLEQVTKERSLRAIVGDPPQLIGHAANAALEAQLVAAKAGVKQRKTEVEGLRREMEALFGPTRPERLGPLVKSWVSITLPPGRG